MIASRKGTVTEAIRKLHRDADLPVLLRVRKSARYALELAMAPLYLRSVSELGRGVRTCGPPRIENLGRMLIGDDVLVRSVNVPVELCTGIGGLLQIGPGARLNYGVSIAAMHRVELGARARLGPYVMITDTDFHDLYERSVRPPAMEVIVEDDVWIGVRAVILPGVRIGRGSIVGAGAVVSRSVEPFSVVGGVPARVLRTLDPSRFQVPG